MAAESATSRRLNYMRGCPDSLPDLIHLWLNLGVPGVRWVAVQAGDGILPGEWPKILVSCALVHRRTASRS